MKGNAKFYIQINYGKGYMYQTKHQTVYCAHKLISEYRSYFKVQIPIITSNSTSQMIFNSNLIAAKKHTTSFPHITYCSRTARRLAPFGCVFNCPPAPTRPLRHMDWMAWPSPSASQVSGRQCARSLCCGAPRWDGRTIELAHPSGHMIPSVWWWSWCCNIA